MADRTERITFPPLPIDFMRVDWGRRVQLFDQLIRQHGYKTEVTPMVVCPCVVHPRDGGKGTPMPNCGICGGTGKVFPEEKKYETISLPHVIRKNRLIQQIEGELELGTLRVTFMSGISIQMWDRLRFVDFKIPTVEVHKVKDGKVKLKFYPWSPEIVAITNPDGTLRILSSTEYTFNQDTWEITFNIPIEGENVSVRYLSSPYYYVREVSPEYRGQPIKQGLPQTKWWDLPIVATAVRGDLLEGV